MKLSFSWICWIVALIAGLVVLAGYFIPVKAIQDIQQTMLQVAMFVAAFGVLAGVFNLLSLHWRRFEGEHKGGGYSLVLILAFLLPVITAILDYFVFSKFKTPFGLLSQWVFNYLLLPVETTLFALLAVVLAYFAARMLRWRTNAFGLIFFGAIIFTLVITSPFLVAQNPQLVHEWLYLGFLQPLALGGARGILLGVALGTIATGIRILLGADRPYG
jgi:hypothetical protein